MTDDPGHKYTFGAPKKGWPQFDEQGRRITEQKPDSETRVDKILELIDDVLRPAD